MDFQIDQLIWVHILVKNPQATRIKSHHLAHLMMDSGILEVTPIMGREDYRETLLTASSTERTELFLSEQQEGIKCSTMELPILLTGSKLKNSSLPSLCMAVTK